jgi:PIN domain nuclease of toxin-antitoxin system
LFEIGRVRAPAVHVFDELAATLGLRLCDAPLPAIVVEAERYTFTRDPFDRLIVAQAALHDAPLVTRDEGIRAAYPRARW